MSRSNPQLHLSNPSTRWMEWNGEKGEVRYYDKEKKENVSMGSEITFLLLDQLGCVNGWNDPSNSAIFSNEVRDSRQEVMVVKSFKGGTIAEGLYGQIKHQVKAAGGAYHANCYIAYKKDGALSIGSLKLRGAALHAWAEFTKAKRTDLDTKAVRIDGYTEGKKGRIIFRVPIFKTVAASEETNVIAVELDKQLQKFLDSYLKRNKSEQVESTMPPAHHVTDEEMAEEPEWYDNPEAAAAVITDDDIAF